MDANAKTEPVTEEEKATAGAIGFIFWIFIVFMIIAIIAGYTVGRTAVYAS